MQQWKVEVNFMERFLLEERKTNVCVRFYHTRTSLPKADFGPRPKKLSFLSILLHARSSQA